MRIAWGAKVSATFVARVMDMAGRLGIADPNWLMGIMAFESGRTFAADVRNAAGSGATGLIQFMPSTARALGTTVEDLAALTPEQQLEWVEKYFRPYAGKLNSLDDVYMAVLWPKAIGWLLNQPLFSRDDGDGRTYMQNKGLDVDQDGVITKGEATAKVQAALNEGLSAGNYADLGVAASPEPQQHPEQQADPVRQPEAPMLPAMLLPLLQEFVLPMLAPRVATAVSKVTQQPPEISSKFVTDFFGELMKLTGKPDPVQAAVALQTGPVEQVKAIEEHALDYLDKLGPVIDKLHQFSRDEWTSEEQSRDAAAARSIQQQQQDGGPLANPTFIIAIFILGLVAVVVGAVLFRGGFSTDMQAFVIGAVVGSSLTAVISFYFGSSRASAAKDVTISQIAQRSGTGK